ncbi:6-phospho-3-hexuloisomerase [Paenibacillus sp. UNCCL117]|uniref:6-phospho-3-hexuloisomerase n=1 Tax=unclassified Paenibacillus TaxID=185978 RepID=UPI0008879EE5|nr:MULTISPECIES: 6-phospho-3-hexuloisomerase [unclassified Paenibacillus]SDC92594.1 6-phospho-3-hexuloisomerase [Paenibacillus sp. cl123]SFW29377.1 6-phospho-3-hexuloisomerase [Paenibacillus sp. UNCCL117]
MQINQYTVEIVKELQLSAAQIAAEEAEKLARLLLSADRVFLAGAGRSGLMGRAFAMRLMHMGLQAYVVGETVTPGIAANDVLVIGSGSGETKSLVSMVHKAKELGAAVALVTTAPESAIGRLASASVKLPGLPKDRLDGSVTTVQPMASLFEQTLLLFYDSVILRMMELKGLSSDMMYARHANLE